MTPICDVIEHLGLKLTDVNQTRNVILGRLKDLKKQGIIVCPDNFADGFMFALTRVGMSGLVPPDHVISTITGRPYLTMHDVDPRYSGVKRPEGVSETMEVIEATSSENEPMMTLLEYVRCLEEMVGVE